MLCSRGRYLAGEGPAPAREQRNGVEIRRVRATSFGRRSHAGRLADYAAFHALAGLRAAASGWADVVVTLTTPPLAGWMGRAAKLLRGVRHVNFVMDLHPDAEFASGLLRPDSVPGRALEGLLGRSLRGADANVVLGRHQGARVLARGVDPRRVIEIPVWSDAREIEPVPRERNPLRERLGWADRFVVMYSGNAGLVHRFEELLDAAEEIDETDPRVLFAFVGGGPRRPEIERAVRERGLSNCEFRPYFDRADLRWSLSAADVHFMSLRPEHVGVAVPGKLYGILAAGRPVLFVGSPACEPAETIAAAGAGLAFQPGQGAELARAIERLRDDPVLRVELGRRGHAHFLAHHERGVCVEAWRRLLEAVAAGRKDLAGAAWPVAARAAERIRLEDVPAALPRAQRAGAPSERR